MDFLESREIIHQTSILSDEDTQFINGNISAIQANWAKRQIFRTETEAVVSVLNDIKFGTPASKWWQCVREQSSMYESLVFLSFEYRRNQVKIRRLEKQLEECEDEFDREELQIDLESALFGKLNQEQVAKDRVRELRMWDALMDKIVEENPDFDREDVNTHQLLSYIDRFEKQAEHLTDLSPHTESANVLGQLETARKYRKTQGAEQVHIIGDSSDLKSIDDFAASVVTRIQSKFDIRT